MAQRGGRLWPKRSAQEMGFRSGLEEKNAAHAEALGQSIEFEQHRLRYAVPLTFHVYTPDFVLSNGIIVETKGRFLPPDRSKHLLVKAQYPALDIRLVFSNPKAYIAKGSKTTLAAWAEKHGFQWASKLIPEEWFLEEGPGYENVMRVLKAGPVGYEQEAA